MPFRLSRQGHFGTDLSATTSSSSDRVARSAILLSKLAAVANERIASAAAESGIHSSTHLSPVISVMCVVKPTAD